MIESKRVFNEFLVRGDDDGNPCGAYVQYKVVTREDGKRIAAVDGGLEPLAVDADTIARVLGPVAAAALAGQQAAQEATTTSLRAQQAAEHDLVVARDALARAIEARDSALQQVASLTADLALSRAETARLRVAAAAPDQPGE